MTETQVLNAVKKVTDVEAYLYCGTLFLKTIDSKIAVDVFNSLYENVTKALAFGKVGEETYYDFI